MTSRPTAILSAFVLALFANACTPDTTTVAPGGEDTTSTSNAATVRVLLKDVPSDYIAAALVDIGEVDLISSDGTHVKLTDNGTDGFVNLLDFQADATKQLAEATIDPGSFVQLRLVIDSARVKLADGYKFKDGSTEQALKIPSGMQSGLKLNLKDATDGGPLAIVPGETVLLLDFNVDKSFVFRGNFKTPAGVHGVIFKPTIQVTGQDVAASISGTVTTSLDGQSVEGLTVRATPTDTGTVAGYVSQMATATTDADGNYTIPYLVPGGYNVTVDPPEPWLATDPASQAVVLANGENTTGVDFDLIDIRGSISGTVSTSLDGVSVEGLTVTAAPVTEGMETLTATVASDGTYTVDKVMPGSYVVTVAVADTLVTDPLFADVDVGTSEDVTGIDFAIVLPVSVMGTVSTSLTGVSVEGLTVTAAPVMEGMDTLTATTASDGTYTFDKVMPGSYVVTVAVADTLVTDPLFADVDVGITDDVTGIDFAIVLPGSIAGTVSTSLTGVSVEGLTVTAAVSGEPVATVETASDGTYKFPALPPASYTITVAVGSNATNPPDHTVDLAAGDAVTGQDFEIVAGT